MNLRMLSLKELKLVEFQIAGSSYSTQLWLTEKGIFKEAVLNIQQRDIISIPNVISSITSGNNFE